MFFKSVNARFLVLLLPLFIGSFALLSFVCFHFAQKEMLLNATQLSCSIGSEVALRTSLTIGSIEVPLKVAADFLKHSRPNVASIKDEDMLYLLNRLKESSPTIHQTFFLLPSGKGIRADGIFLDRSSREYFKHVMETRSPYISKPFMGETSKVLQTMVLSPVLDNNGGIYGIFMASIHLDKLLSKVLEKEYLKIDDLCIIDESGYIVGTSGDPSDLGRSVLLPEDDPSALASPLDQEVVEGFRQAIKSKEQQVIPFTDIDEVEHFATFTPFEISGNTWTVVTLIANESILKPVYRLMHTVAWIFIALLVLTAILIVIFSKSFFTPIEKLANKLRTAGFAKEKTSEDEIAVLIAGISKIKELNKELNLYKRQATFDEVTGLFNRFGFQEKAEQFLAARKNQRVSLTLAVLANARHIADSFGREKAATALKDTADIFKENTEPPTVLARIDWDLFACLMKESAETAKNTLHRSINEFNKQGTLPYLLELSFESIEFDCTDDISLNALLKQADEVLSAKKDNTK
ncbi:MAG: diguanylate cyclase [Desulfovibrionaceae bacterium]|nr:diguanylate cyclase [Desulfovibrionaceae bacterium]